MPSERRDGVEPTITGPDGVCWFAATDEQTLHRLAFRRIATAAAQAIEQRGQFRIVLAGGTTPRAIYRLLRSQDLDWPCWQVYFGDERCLPPGDAARNSRMAAEALLEHVPITPEGIHPIPAELGAAAAAAAYSETLRHVPAFDLVLLGLGEDGHTASLFPGHDWGTGLRAPAALAVLDAPKPPAERVTLSARRLGQAHAVLFLVKGESKRQAVQRWRQGEDIPARAVRSPGGVAVLVDATLLVGG
jgi:6-phosphogluconolactonase